MQLYLRQRGRCFYTRVPLEVRGEWRWSMERLDDNQGYTQANVVLVIQRVNHGISKWSKKKAAMYWGALAM